MRFRDNIVTVRVNQELCNSVSEIVMSHVAIATQAAGESMVNTISSLACTVAWHVLYRPAISQCKRVSKLPFI